VKSWIKLVPTDCFSCQIFVSLV